MMLELEDDGTAIFRNVEDDSNATQLYIPVDTSLEAYL
jgi:hypothetical protein